MEKLQCGSHCQVKLSDSGYYTKNNNYKTDPICSIAQLYVPYSLNKALSVEKQIKYDCSLTLQWLKGTCFIHESHCLLSREIRKFKGVQS